MHSLLVIVLFYIFSTSHNITVESFDLQNIENELTEFNISCKDDNCQMQIDKEDPFLIRACDCGTHCVQLGTCCFDSPYVDVPEPELKPTCRYVPSSVYYFMVDSCPYNDSVWAGLCNDKSTEDDDVQKLVPVASLLTSITYKNYYCFKCHETTDEFLYWTLKIRSKYALPSFSEDESEEIVANKSIIYDKDKYSLMAFYDDEIGYIRVSYSFEIPPELVNTTYSCAPDVISDCSDQWSDEEVRSKCQSYMALKSVIRDRDTITYKNIHCALCNNENLNDISCREERRTRYGSGYGGHHHGGYRPTAGRFTFTYLLDINRSDGELVGMIQKCPDDHLWDPFAKKCRTLSCALPGFKVKNAKCVSE